MDVDEARSDDAIARVDHARRAPAREVADVGDSALGHGDVRAHRRDAAAVDHAPAANEEVGHLRRSRPLPRSRRRATTSSFGDVGVTGDPS